VTCAASDQGDVGTGWQFFGNLFVVGGKEGSEEEMGGWEMGIFGGFRSSSCDREPYLNCLPPSVYVRIWYPAIDFMRIPRPLIKR
jgi:hypothetical protein